MFALKNNRKTSYDFSLFIYMRFTQLIEIFDMSKFRPAEFHNLIIWYIDGKGMLNSCYVNHYIETNVYVYLEIFWHYSIWSYF